MALFLTFFLIHTCVLLELASAIPTDGLIPPLTQTHLHIGHSPLPPSDSTPIPAFLTFGL